MIAQIDSPQVVGKVSEVVAGFNDVADEDVSQAQGMIARAAGIVKKRCRMFKSRIVR